MNLSATTLLNTWEDGLGQGAIHRALLLLALCPTVPSATALADVCLGERDAHLLALRQRLFGSRLDGSATCPACGELLELSLLVEDILVDAQPRSGQRYWASASADADVGYDVCYRLPTSADLLRVASAVARTEGRAGRGLNAPLVRSELLRLCVLEAYIYDTSGNRVAASINTLPESVVAALVAHMGQTDPQGDVELALSCPACRHAWLAPFDIGSYLWAEVEAWAQHVLHEVHTLAAGYGWPEADILAMSAWRRQWYLQALT